LEFIYRLVEEEYVARNNTRASQLLKRAGLWKTQADLSKIDYAVNRKLNRDLLSQLVTCDFILDKKNLCILGAAGSGKSFFAKAFGGEATTIVCSQVDPDDWCEKFSGYTIGNAITSRLISNGFSLVIQSDEDLRHTKYPGEL